jgi:hypothetical protein
MAISPPLARRLERLARRAHAFHRFAHHPLCERYAGELIVLRGRNRICRGCSCAAVGGMLGGGTALLLSLPLTPLLLASAIMLAALLLPRRREKRPGKLWTRALPAFSFSAVLVTLLQTPSWQHLCLALTIAAPLAMVFTSYRRRGPDRSACVQCPERHAVAPCSGFRTIVHAERAFTRRAHQLMDAAAAQTLRSAP